MLHVRMRNKRPEVVTARLLLNPCVRASVCMCVRADLPLSPGTAAMQMILAEQTAIQASTVGSSLMFNRHTWRETEELS